MSIFITHTDMNSFNRTLSTVVLTKIGKDKAKADDLSI